MFFGGAICDILWTWWERGLGGNGELHQRISPCPHQFPMKKVCEGAPSKCIFHAPGNYENRMDPWIIPNSFSRKPREPSRRVSHLKSEGRKVRHSNFQNLKCSWQMAPSLDIPSFLMRCRRLLRGIIQK